MARKAKSHVGGLFDDFLKEEGIYDDVQTTATKRVLAWQLTETMKKRKLTKVEMAKRMETSRAQVDRLLDPNNNRVTLTTLSRAGAIVGRKVKI